MLRTKEFGFSIGAFKPLGTETINLSLETGGVDKSKSPTQLVDGAAAAATDVRVIAGGVSTDFGYTAFGSPYGGADKSVVGIAPYEQQSGVKFLMRLRSTGWDRWNGVNWLTLSGALTGSPDNRLYTSVQKDLAGNDWFVGANGVDKLKAWNGVDATPIADLSSDAPIAKYITRIGTRLLVASVKVSGVLHPNLVAWCADGNILDWSNTPNGAGSTELLAEGSGRKANYITGLSTVARGAVVYRQQAIQLGLLTGVGTAPLRFTTVDFSHGTESPYTICNGGMETGDFFLGSDYMPYNFNGDAQPTPIGGPIHDELLRTIPKLSEVLGAIDTGEQDFWLAFSDTPGGAITKGWCFNIREWNLKRRAVWRKRTLPLNVQSFGFGNVVAISDPIVNTVSNIVDTMTTRVNDFGLPFGPDRILFGDNIGQIYYLDKSLSATGGSWESRQISHPQGHVLTVDRTRLKCQSTTGGNVFVSVSTDGGLTYSPEKQVVCPITTLGPIYLGTDHGVTGRSFMIRLRPSGGFVTVTDIEVTYQDKGNGNG